MNLTLTINHNDNQYIFGFKIYFINNNNKVCKNYIFDLCFVCLPIGYTYDIILQKNDSEIIRFFFFI